MNTFNNIIYYFFSANPGKTFTYSFLIIAIAILLIGLAIAIKYTIFKHKEDKPFRKIFKPWVPGLVTIAILLLLYIFFRSNQVPMLSMRFFLYLLVAISIYQFAGITYAYTKTYPELKAKKLIKKKKGK
jgi:amino acid transporter